MLNLAIDYKRAYRCVVYLRMSTDKQNPRSPKQQLAEINRRIKAMGLSWIIIKEYEDSAISGTLIRKRPEFHQMLLDLRTGAVQADLILVDSFKRFGRAEELDEIRRQLQKDHGIYLLTADRNFADPNTPEGQLQTRVDSWVAVQDNRSKAHDVRRGKIDAVQLMHWPGGRIPFGYKLESVYKMEKGRQVLDYSYIVPDAKTRWILSLLYGKAKETNWGSPRLRKFLDGHPDIPAELKPFNQSTVGRWLRDPIYIGIYDYGVRCTDTIDDRRVSQKNPTDQVTVVPDFCEPLVDQELFHFVQGLCQVHARQHPGRRSDAVPEGKLIAPLAPGVAVNYLLSGLVYCGKCGLRMTASSQSEYITSSGEARRYVHYVCSHSCGNTIRVSEPWLRQQVVPLVINRVFPRSA